MTRVEFTPLVHPARGAITAGVTLGITLIALKALDRLNAGTGIAATIFSASTGFVASSLHIRPDEIENNDDDWGAKYRIPAMEDNVLAEPWSASECTRIKKLDSCNEGRIIREAALSGTIDMVRWGLEKAFSGENHERRRYYRAFEGPWPQFNNQPLSPDHPIRDLYDRSGEERFKVVADLLDAVKEAAADPEGYAIPNTLPQEDQELLTRILPGITKVYKEDEELKSKVVDELAKRHPLTKAELRELVDLEHRTDPELIAYRIIGVENCSLDGWLERAKELTHPIAEWTHETRYLVRLHAHLGASSLADLPLEEAAEAKEVEVLECLLHVAKKRGWKIKKAEQTRLRDLAKT